jgi:hypothetical protein
MPNDSASVTPHPPLVAESLDASQPADAFGARFFRLRDPDGFRLVISSPQAS